MTQRDGQKSAPTAEQTQHWEIVLRNNVGNMESAMLANQAILWLINTNLDAADGYGTKMSPWDRIVSFMESQQHVVDSTNSRGTLDNGVENRLHVRGRSANDAEYLGCCRLMLQRLAQLRVALVEFFKQPYVFDGDHRLIGEG